MIFRAADGDDVDQIAELHARSWQKSYRGILREEFLRGDVFQDRHAVWTKRLHQPRLNQHVIVAVEGNRLGGFACAYGAEDAKWGTLLDNLHVRADLKSRGIGTRLIGKVARWSADRYPKCKFHLWVFGANHSARHFYERLGAVHSESTHAQIPGGGNAIEYRYTWEEVATLVLAVERRQILSGG